MNISKVITLISILTVLLTGGMGCKKESEVVYGEPLKDISGSWKIVKLTRNGENLTSRIQFDDFRIVFNEDSSYSFEGRAPFIINQSGTYRLDDPKYPFRISFLTKDHMKDTLAIKYPIVKGERQIRIEISPGCSENTYDYVFERE